MTLRPIPARWFELVTVHKDLPKILECLSRTGAVELDARSDPGDRALLPKFTEPLKAYRELARRSLPYWPRPILARGQSDLPLDRINAAQQRLAAWQGEADPMIAAIERLSQETADLKQLKEALFRVGAGLPDLKLLVGAGPTLQARLLLLPAGAKLRERPPLVLWKRWETPAADYVLLVGRQSDIREIETQVSGLKGRAISLPDWLASSAEAAVSATADRLTRLAEDTAVLQAKLTELSERLQIADALGQMALAEWLDRYVPQLHGSERLAWVTGWTSDPQGRLMRAALDAEGVHYILHVSKASAQAEAPLVLSNPGWARAFEVFARMLGMPARNESDPSVILAFIVPVIFGFMFGDLGQGLVVCVVGAALGPRVPLLRMLIPGGVMAMIFGLLFGSVFAREDLIPALWVRPLTDPIVILAAAIAIGVFVLTIGMLLSAVQAHWSGHARIWWGHQAGLVAVYFGLIAGPVRIEGLVVAALGACWYVVGAAVFVRAGGVRAVGRAAGELVEQTMQLLVNTISFARVGAFALAHAGLSAAIVTVAAATGRIGYWIVLVLGNVLIIALEGLVVGIQTTRLVLFEFFIRFLSAEGREFKPFPPPDIVKPTVSEPSLGSTS
jgi:V/A-type H+-transporting ATPase subunit I